MAGRVWRGGQGQLDQGVRPQAQYLFHEDDVDPMRTNARKDAGMTLIEITIAAIILLVVVAISMGILFACTTIVNKETRASALQHRGRTLVEFCRDQFYLGRFRDPQNRVTLGISD